MIIMSIFLEDVNFNGELSLTEATDFGFMQLALESDLAWANIEMQAMKEEYIAITEEDEKKAEAASKGFFQKVKEFFIKIGQKIRYFVQSTLIKIADRVGIVEKAASKRTVKADDALSKIKVKVYSEKSQFQNELNDYYVLAQSIINGARNVAQGAPDKEAYKKQKEELESRANLEKKEVTLNKGMVEQAIKFLKSGSLSKMITALKSHAKIQMETVKRGIATAEAGLKGSDKEAIKKSKENTNAQKKACSLINTALSVGIKGLNKSMIDAWTVFKAGTNKA